LRPLPDGTAEIKRLYVRPAWRGSGLGRRLAEAALIEAASRGYAVVRLDSTPAMRAARALYASLGFAPIPPYGTDAWPGFDCFEKRLAPAREDGPAA
jgi:ribosomal protein S18 acetylase RimI-like enzyme